jgi:hypothetical protein
MVHRTPGVLESESQDGKRSDPDLVKIQVSAYWGGILVASFAVDCQDTQPIGVSWLASAIVTRSMKPLLVSTIASIVAPARRSLYQPYWVNTTY